MANSTAGIRRIINATKYSIDGFKAAWLHEAAFRQELMLCVLLTPAALWLARSALETGVLLATLLIVLITELLNSAVEAITDRVGTENHELSGRAKDLASAAVFTSLVLVVTVWGFIAYDRFA